MPVRHEDRNLCEVCLATEYDSFRHTCVHELMDLNKVWREKYKIDSWPRWDYELDSGVLTFSEGGLTKVIADVAVVGTVQGSQWEWSWGNVHTPTRHREQTKRVYDFGALKEWNKLTTLFLESNEYLGWELTAVAAHVLNAKAGYRCPNSGHPDHFTYLAILQTNFPN
jgi:hypothetical protein